MNDAIQNQQVNGDQPSLEALQNANRSLQQTIERLEEDLQQQRQLLAAMTADRDQYRRSLCQVLWKYQFQPTFPSEAELMEQIQNGEWLPLSDDFRADLERLAKG
jgi:hypothetical protein